MDEKIILADDAFRLAIKEAMKGAPFVSPNPLVGCVIVDTNQKLLATGYHARYGEAHAEVEALRKLQPEQLKGATVYVTLEPCAHQGKTPSCAKALAKLPLKKVVYGLRDPNPLVSGQGAEILRQAGIEAVEYQGVLKTEIENLCEIFLKNMTEGKIFVAVKIASSLDGQIGLKTGESKWITGPESREKVHALRACYDAIVVGRQTVEADNPSLNIRHPEIQKETRLIIIDPASTLLNKIQAGHQYQFTKTHKKENIFFATKKIAPEIHYQQIEFTNLASLNKQLWSHQIKSILVEGGAVTYSNYLQEGLVDRLHLFMAPSIIGADSGLSWSQKFFTAHLNDQIRLRMQPPVVFGTDIYISGRIISEAVSSGPKV